MQDDSARHSSGIYYTRSDALVRFTLGQAVDPLLDGARAAFAAQLDALKGDRRSEKEQRADLARFDAAVAMLAVRMLDPAMGSGHFLVALSDYMADAITAAIGAADEAETIGYVSPVAEEIARERAEIEATAAMRGWPLNHAALGDRQIIRRLVLKRVPHGVQAIHALPYVLTVILLACFVGRAVRLPISSARSGRGSLNGFCRSPGSTGCHHATFALARPPAAATSGGKLFLPCCGGLAPNGRVAGPAAGRQRPDDACRRVGLRDGRDHRRAALEQASLPAPWSFCGGSADGPGKCSRQATPRQRDAANCGRGCACSSGVQPAGGTSVFTLTSYHSA